MKRIGLVVCLLLCVLLLVPAAYAHRDDTTIPPVQMSINQPAAKLGFRGGSSPCICGGTWKTNWGQMVLSQTSDGKVTGDYTHDQGKIEGTISGNSFSGRWSEAPSYQDPNDGGLVEFQFDADCMTFTGRWKYGTSGDWKENNWTGEKIQGASKLWQ